MPDKNDSGMIDGFRSVQAARRAAEKGKRPSTAPPESTPSPPEEAMPPPDGASNGKKIGRTAMPTRHEIVCYSCTYTFTLAGRLDNVYCPKCRERLESGDITVASAWARDVKTVGTVTVTAQGAITGGTIIATDIVVGGDVTAATLKPTRHLILDTSARMDWKSLPDFDVAVGDGARLVLDGEMRCRRIEIRGELSAHLHAEDTVTVRPGGYFHGRLQTPRLVIEEGGKLSAHVDIGPHHAPRTPEPAVPTEDAAPRRTAPDGPAPTPVHGGKGEKPRNRDANPHGPKPAAKTTSSSAPSQSAERPSSGRSSNKRRTTKGAPKRTSKGKRDKLQ